jgi:hypothetical protein
MLTVVAPIFNERDSVEELWRRLALAVAPLGEHEIVLVDDSGS